MAGWHHQFDGYEFEWTPGVGDGQGGLCCSSWGCKESDTTERLNWTELTEFTVSFFCYLWKWKSENHLVMSNSLWLHRLYSPWNSPGQNTGVGSFSFSSKSSQPRDQTHVSRIAGRLFTSWTRRQVLFSTVKCISWLFLSYIIYSVLQFPYYSF